MPKSTFTFDLNDPDDKDLFKIYCQAEDMHTAVWSFLNQDLRNLIKYPEDSTDSVAHDTACCIRQILLERLEQYNVELD